MCHIGDLSFGKRVILYMFGGRLSHFMRVCCLDVKNRSGQKRGLQVTHKDSLFHLKAKESKDP